MENEFVTYQKFNDKESADALAEVLTNHQIEYLIEDTSATFDITFSSNELAKEYRVKVKKQDFDRIYKILIELEAQHIDEVDKDYYLFQFSDEELIEILLKSDEWSKFDYVLAQKILKDRGQEVNEKLLDTLRKQRIEQLSKPEEGQKSWIIGGYIFALLGGILGILIGYHLLSHKKTLPNGERVYGYTSQDRKQGKIIVILGSIFLVIWTIVRI